MKKAVAYWRDEFDWRAAEAKLNGMGMFTATVDGMRTHFVHRRSPHPNAKVLIFNHGWPGSFFEVAKLLEPLVNDPDRPFHVVCPSLPGTRARLLVDSHALVAWATAPSVGNVICWPVDAPLSRARWATAGGSSSLLPPPCSTRSAALLCACLRNRSPARPGLLVACARGAGYGFSEAPSRRGFDSLAIAEHHHKLMQLLGYSSYYAQGGDWGSMITRNMGVLYPGQCLGVHVQCTREHEHEAPQRPLNMPKKCGLLYLLVEVKRVRL